MKYIGAHVSTDGGIDQAPLNAQSIGAKSFALFTRNPARWKSKALGVSEIDAFRAIAPHAVILPTSFCLTTVTSLTSDLPIPKSLQRVATHLPMNCGAANFSG